MAKTSITIDRITDYPNTPSDNEIQTWVLSALKRYPKNAILTIRLVDTKESATLNQRYRQKTGPTNILSFCFEPPPGMTSDILGDIVLCPQLIEEEESSKSHWAHLLIHGCLHLLGFHHNEEMETLEIEYLNELGYSNPY